jgi:hypothetical protein
LAGITRAPGVRYAVLTQFAGFKPPGIALILTSGVRVCQRAFQRNINCSIAQSIERFCASGPSRTDLRRSCAQRPCPTDGAVLMKAVD